MASKSNKALGAALLLALGVGAYLGNLIPKLGWGTGSGFLGQAGEAVPTPATEPEPVSRAGKQPPASNDLADPASDQPAPAAVVVRIDGHELLLQGPDGEYTQTAAAEVARLAASANPAEGAPRLRVELTPRSRARAETELQQALRAAQVAEGDVLWIKPTSP